MGPTPGGGGSQTRHDDDRRPEEAVPEDPGRVRSGRTLRRPQTKPTPRSHSRRAGRVAGRPRLRPVEATLFRAARYAPDYPGLAGKELKPGKTVEATQPKEPEKKAPR